MRWQRHNVVRWSAWLLAYLDKNHRIRKSKGCIKEKAISIAGIQTSGQRPLFAS
jgi:hypothetical protein